MLEETLAYFIWDVSVGHAVDHYDHGTLYLNENSMRLRIPPPSSPDCPDFDIKKATTWFDFFRYRQFWKMFIEPTTVTYLYKTRYGFEEPELIAANTEFLQQLREPEAAIEASDIPNFIPLKKISRTIQY